MTSNDFKRLKRRPRAYTVRRALKLTQQEFTDKFHVPIGTLWDWEQGISEPDSAARAYLHVISVNHEAVLEALKQSPKRVA